jgi:hypothetical protein
MAPLNGPSELQKPVSERRLAVVDVRDNGKVSDPFWRVLAQIYDILFAALAGMRGKSMAQTKMVVSYSGAYRVAFEYRGKWAKFRGSVGEREVFERF